MNLFHYALDQGDIDEINRIRPISPSTSNLQATGSSVGTPLTVQTPFAENSLLIDSIDDGKVIPHASNNAIENEFTVTFWVRLDQEADGQWRSLIHKGNNNQERSISAWLNPVSSKIDFSVSTTQSWNAALQTQADIPQGEWTQAGITVKGNNISIYVNGQLDNTRRFTGSVVNNNGDLHIGSSPWYGGAKSAISAVNIYKRALDKAEMSGLYRRESLSAR